MNSPPRDGLEFPSSLPKTSSIASTSSASSQEFSQETLHSHTPPPEISTTPQTATTNSFIQTIIMLLQAVKATVLIYILSIETLMRQHIEQYSQKDTQKINDNEKMPEKNDSVPEIVGRSRTGTNVREVMMAGGSRNGSLEETRKRGSYQSVSSVENRRPRPSAKSTKGTGFDEPFCKFRNTTLPHPSADLSPNASISDPDIAYSKAHHRVRFPGRRISSKGVAHGKILPGEVGYSSGGKFGTVATSESAMGSSLEGLYDNIVYEDGSKEMALTKSRTGLSGSTNVGSPVEPIIEVDTPSEKLLKPAEIFEINSRPSTNSDWERDTSKALERIMSPLASHPVSPKTTTTIIPKTPKKESPNSRFSISPSAPIIKPGGFKRISNPSPQHSKKDSGIGLARLEVGSRDSNKSTLSGEYIDPDSGNDEATTPTRKRERGLLRKMRTPKT